MGTRELKAFTTGRSKTIKKERLKNEQQNEPTVNYYQTERLII